MSVAESKNVKLSAISDGPICRIVRQEVVFAGSGTAMPETAPMVVYHWFFFKDSSGLIYVTADYSQSEPMEWRERHLLELHIADGSFGEYLDIAKPAEKKKFEGVKNTMSAKGAAMLDGVNRISMFGSGNVTVYDGLKSFGPYLLGNGHAAWTPWNETTGHESVWLQFDTGTGNMDCDTDYAAFEHRAGATLSIPELDATVKTWTDTARNSLFYAGILKTKRELEAFQIDEKRFYAVQSDMLGMVLEKTVDGLRLMALVDLPSKKLLTPHEPQSLFAVKLREANENGFIVRNLTSDRGWTSVEFWPLKGSGPDTGIGINMIKFSGRPELPGGEAVSMQLAISANPQTRNAEGPCPYWPASIEMLWMRESLKLPENLTLESATLPTIKLAPFGNRMKAFYPQASGIVIDRPFHRNKNWHGRYPSGWSTMPWYAVWNDTKEERIGLYVAAHDKDGTTKEQRFRTDAQNGMVDISLEYPAENLGRKDARFAPCRIVLESYRGDWFDAAKMYRDWMRREATWFPREKIGPEGRTDTPLWMKELCVWALGSTLPDKMPEALRKFQEPLGVPTGLHWYNWHQIPFDNDYPHYFPTKDGFKNAVAKIQEHGDLFVMPYINGRLWDTRDRGMEDWLFTKEALPGVTKKEDGTSYVETYGSKESDGSKVELGVMCPASQVWFDKQRDLIRQLTWDVDDDDIGVSGVYVDQVAAAAPALCFDESHGHPVGGGAWWVSTYKKMFEEIRSGLPEGAMLTTECNAEPFIDLFDGYLTWHFQHDGQVPGFAAVYGGSVQMFGRAYGEDPDKMVAARMKMAESFVFGEQLGWISPHVVNEPERYDFFKKVVALRCKFRDYFYKGEMARPPKLLGEMPKITADWHFSGQPTIVTLGVVQTGAWIKPGENSVILMFANFSDQPQENRLQVDLAEWGFERNKIKVVRHNPDGSEQKLEVLPETICLEAKDAFVLEVTN